MSDIDAFELACMSKETKQIKIDDNTVVLSCADFLLISSIFAFDIQNKDEENK